MTYNAYQFDMDFLKESFKEFAWLFARVSILESRAYFPWYVLFVLCVTFRMNLNFDWTQIISNEVSHQLLSYQQIERFFMTTYLVYVVICNCIVKEFSVKRDIDISQESHK